ncbi:Integral membrane sensor signal transduction histidine kinase [Thiocapsa sp. KS1]|nr:Integral membrane sensor signal transduction histidine kinase [Thiocapsa sp. KS1]
MADSELPASSLPPPAIGDGLLATDHASLTMRPMGRLFWKFFFAFWLALLLAGSGVGSAVWLHQRALDAGRDLEGGPRAAFLVGETAIVFRYGGIRALRELLSDWDAREGGAHVFVVDDAERELLGRPVAAETLAQARRLAQRPGEPRIARLERVAERDYLFFVPAEGRAPRHGAPSPWLPILTGILASLGFSALLAWYLSKPVRHLRAAFDAVAAGRLDTRIGARMGRRRDEIADLGRDFDHMAGQLQLLISSQRRLLHDVSHELRSPLARLQAAIGLARQRPETLDGALDRIEREAIRLDRLVGELLTLSRLEAGMGGTPGEETDLVELTRIVAEDARFEAEAAGRRVRFFGDGEALIQAHAELLHRALENVIRNAVKFTDEGTVVEIAIVRTSDPERLVVTVSDRGPGVPEDQLQAIFEPFFRGMSRGRAAGFGLGLAIARGAVEAHGGHICALNRACGGLQVEIVLPAQTGFG